MNAADSLFSSSAGTMAVVALVLAFLALGGVVLLLARQQRLLGQYQHLMTGTSGGNLEAMLNDHVAKVRETEARVEAVDRLARRLEKAAYFSLQHMGMVRFNPFHDTGGDQSFAIALVDGHGNGLVLSSLHGRDATRVYAKPLQKWESTYSLTDEEKQAIALAYQKQS
jgi:enoyl-CoA hydratase/carnithine racemase